MVGFGANRRGGRLPSFILIFLMVIIAILSFNYWTVSGKHSRVLDELAEVQTQVKRTDAARSRLEKRNSELMVQVDTHRKQMDLKDQDYNVLEVKLQTRDALIKKCSDEKIKLQGDVTAQMTEIQRLKEQLRELKQEFMKQEEQIRDVKKNSTTLERKLEYESLQCGRQIAQLKDEYEETKRSLEAEAAKLRQSLLEGQKGVVAAGHAEGQPGGDAAGERHAVTTHRHNRQPDLKEEMGKPGSDAGMPGIEDSEVGKMEDVQFALKKPAITQKRDEAPDMVVGAGAGPGPAPGLGEADGPVGQSPLLDQPRLQQDRLDGRAAVIAVPGMIKPADKPIVFEEDNKAGIQADEAGEQPKQLGAPDNVLGDSEHMKRMPLPQNPAQVPNPIQPLIGKEQAPAEPVHHRQNDDDRDMQGDRAGDYGKRHQGNDGL
ncbi:protein CASC4 isoform X2 [Salarias fasciatus]|uniref:Protein GOLM2 n=1 Tax=Salarias fasciatus TaxID=181472 RepID=A0A672JML8_SALFA|nr:protein CASC4 isoform X2 [Salarias fasciatus]